MKSFLTSHKLQIFLAITLTFAMWFKIFGQSILGEGYYYFDSGQDFIINGHFNNLWQYDNFARFSFDIMAPIFRGNIFYYMAFQMAILIIINLVFYKVIYSITNNKLLSITCVILFLGNYMASFEMVAIGNYQRFIQRQPNLIPLLLSYGILFSFLQSRRFKTILTAITLFAFSIFLGHFAMFMVPMFIILPLVFILFRKKTKKEIFINLVVAFSFAGVAKFLVSQDFHSPISLIDFLQEETYLIPKLFIQLTNTSLPPGIIQLFLDTFGRTYGYITTMTWLGALLSLIFLIPIVSSLRNKKSQSLILYAASVFTLPLIFFFNLWLYRANIDPLTQVGQARFYYIPSFMTSFIWSYILVFGFLSKFRENHFKLIAIILTAYLVHNYYFISKGIAESQYKSSSMNIYLKFIYNNIENITPNSAIVTPTSLAWPAPLIGYLTGYNTIKYLQFEPGWEKQLEGIDKNKTFVIGYDYKSDQVIDLTDKYRNNIKIDYANFR